MDDVIIPLQINIKDIFSKKYNLSPSNYKTVNVKTTNQMTLGSLLDTNTPFIRGFEPGSASYLKDMETDYKFVRNSCIDKINNIVQLQRTVSLNENTISYNKEQLLKDGDIIVSTDANIGDSAYLKIDGNVNFLLSSGIVKLNVKKNINKYYLLALLKDSYFNSQLDSMTPKGSTIRHSGTRILDCKIPFPSEENSWIIEIIENLMKNIIHVEKSAQNIQEEIIKIFDNELDFPVDMPSTKISDMLAAKRIDAGFYSQDVREFFRRVEQYPNGSKDLEELGYKTKRGPSLQKRDLGRSIKTEMFHPTYSLLVYPSDISDYGIIDKTIFLGAAGKVWFLEDKDILFSAEGNVGKTFAICDNSLRFTTNIHGIIITPLNKNNVELINTIYISVFLNYMKQKGIMDKLSVGGQGGSFAVQYWEILKFPNVKQETKKKLKKLYFSEYKIHPFDFKEEDIGKLGIYEINKLRMLCVSLLKLMINDIKSDKIQRKEYYLNQLTKIIEN